ncbi:hypothetical protein CEE44_04200 [Candidatus Woesearchaeota archaeon B3_Woes]|nr:MAG: hypothetical protein CEE44_04200 [Candidatus Woesearchaeota archaeon B3_Woes]
MIEDFQKKLEENLKKGLEIEKIVSIIKRCPQCHNLTLEFDSQNNKIICTKCGFTQDIMR